jgi:hypothetical protein
MATLKLIFVLALLAAMVLVGVKVIPPYFSNYEFVDSMKSEALQSTYTARTEDDVRDAVIKQARSYDIVLTPKQVRVTRIGNYGAGSIAIEADYTVPIDLPGYSTTIDFHPSTKNKGVF